MSKEDDLQQQEADFQAEMVRLGFDTRQAEPEAKTEAEVTQAEPAQQAVPEEKKEDQPDDPTIGGRITLSEFNNAMSRLASLQSEFESLKASNAKSHGKIGELNRTIQTLRQQQAPATQTSNALQNVSAEFPELAEALQKDFGHLLNKQQEVEQVDAAPTVNPQDQIAEQRQQLIQELWNSVQEVHPDLSDVIRSSAWNAWTATLPADELANLKTTLNPMVAVKYVNRFKERQASLMATETKQRSDKAQKLAQAVMPAGGAGGSGRPASATERDEFERELKRLLPRR